VLVQFGLIPPVTASAAGAGVGAVINYLMNYRFTFRSSRRHRDTVWRFAIVACVSLAANTLLMWIGIELLKVHYLISQLVTTALVLLGSFSVHRFWTFRPGSP
jgi:putative flippase GtrA